MDRASLADRLARAKSGEMTVLPVFVMFTEDYFEGLAELERDSYFREKYCNDVVAYAYVEAEPERRLLPLDEFVAAAGSLPLEEKISLLYTVLAEPFLRMEQKRYSRKINREDGALW